jgi:hypothetical protein
VEVLKKGGKELLFIAMALDIKLRSTSSLDIDSEEVEQSPRVPHHPQMVEDPY